MRKIMYGAATAALLLGSPALAADLGARMPVKAPAYVAAYNWTGFYLGVNVGYSWARATDTGSLFTGAGAPAGSFGSSENLNGVIGGGQIGYNWQTGNLLLGVEADFQGSGERNDIGATCVGAAGVALGGCSVSGTDRIRWFGTARGRVGYAADRWLFYVTGGGSWLNLSSDVSITGAAPFAPLGVTAVSSNSTTRFGWVLGGGVETALWSNWTGGVEYLYIDTGNYTQSFVVPTALAVLGATGTETVRVKENVIRAKLNYRF
jgi:outer membrane immunogenic protein